LDAQERPRSGNRRQDETGQPVKLRFVALLQDSLFQSELLLSDRELSQAIPGATAATSSS